VNELCVLAFELVVLALQGPDELFVLLVRLCGGPVLLVCVRVGLGSLKPVESGFKLPRLLAFLVELGLGGGVLLLL
jgi:hypothetical protein